MDKDVPEGSTRTRMYQRGPHGQGCTRGVHMDKDVPEGVHTDKDVPEEVHSTHTWYN